jgi:plasmid stabilization system protein ParE
LSSLRPRHAEGVPPVAWANTAMDEEVILQHLSRRFDADVARACIASLRRAIEVEVAVTRDVLAVVADAGVQLAVTGLEHRMKSPGSLARKIVYTWDKVPTAETAEEVALEIGDALRYTVRVEDTAGFYAAVDHVCEQLLARGYTVEAVTDSFVQETRYKGLHVDVRGPDRTTRLEVQFHTAESADVKEETHGLYELLRNPDEDPDRRREAYRQIVATTRGLADPPGRRLSWVGPPFKSSVTGCRRT